MLKLLPCTLLITVGNRPVVDFLHVWEAVDNEGAQEHGVADFIALDRQTHQVGQGLQLRDLNEAVDVVILEEQALELLETLQFRNI